MIIVVENLTSVKFAHKNKKGNKQKKGENLEREKNSWETLRMIGATIHSFIKKTKEVDETNKMIIIIKVITKMMNSVNQERERMNTTKKRQK